MGGGELVGYMDTNWVNDMSNQNLVSGYVFLYAGGNISWMSKQQLTTATSLTHAEYIAAAEAVKELVWLRHLLSELWEPISGPTTLYVTTRCTATGHVTPS